MKTIHFVSPLPLFFIEKVVFDYLFTIYISGTPYYINDDPTCNRR